MAFRPAKDGSEQPPKKAGRTERVAPWRDRPRVADPKNKFVAIRLTTLDHARLTEEATLAGLSVGAFMRKAGLGKTGPRARHQATANNKALTATLAHLGKMGSNLNQHTRWLNTYARGGNPATLAAIHQTLATLLQEFSAYRAELRKMSGNDD